MMKKRNIVLGDLFVILPFAWVMSQALLHMDLFWAISALFLFDVYAVNRRRWNV